MDGLIMHRNIQKVLSDFWVIGINFRNVGSADRGRYVVSQEQYQRFLLKAKGLPHTEVVVVSTCNRTEIYSYTKHLTELVGYYLEIIGLHSTDYEKVAICKNGEDALKHLLHVSAGLESQILGDYEIVGQLKQAFQTAKSEKLTGVFLDRVFATLLHSSREIRCKTQLSSGSVSTAHAAAQFINDNCKKAALMPQILVIGAGEIARNTLLNLVKFFPSEQLTVTNRTLEKAKAMSQELSIAYIPFDQVTENLQTFDAIITAINSTSYIITPKTPLNQEGVILIDLAIPNNISPAIAINKHITYANLDTISKWNDETLKNRAKEIPKAEAIIEHHIQEFIAWLDMRKHVPFIRSIKEKILHFNQQNEELLACADDATIQKALNSMAMKLKNSNSRKPGCNYIETFADYVNKNTSIVS